MRLLLAGLAFTTAALLAAACGGDDGGLPPPSAVFTPDPCSGEVSLQAGIISGRTAELQVRIDNVSDVLAANFDLVFQTFRCSQDQSTCFTDNDCPQGEVCQLSGTPVARILTSSISDSGSFLDCGLPGELLTFAVPDQIEQERYVFALVRNNFRACSSNTTCDEDTDCTPTGELCGEAGVCVEPASPCNTAGCDPGETCVEGLCDSGLNGFLISVPFEILTRGQIRVDFADPKGLEDATGPIAGIGFCGGLLEGI